jgi:hypothetical protein
MLKRAQTVFSRNVRVVVSLHSFVEHISFGQPDQVVGGFYCFFVELNNVVFCDFSQILRSQTVASEQIA